jgi:hypothetical protein
MITEVMMGKVSRLALFVAALGLVVCGVASAQVIKKYVTPDGKTIYSDEPVPGAREVGVVAPPPEVSPEQRRAAEEAAQRNSELSDDVNQRATEQVQEETSQRDRIRAAEKDLEAAKRTLEQGKEPLPGERKGTAGGASRLTEAYFQRQQANEQAVKKAQQKLDAARSGG